MKSISFTVLGTPAPKGSSRAILRGGAAVNAPSGSDANKRALVDWGGAVRAAATEAVRLAHGNGFAVYFGDVALRLKIEFRLRRPKAHFRKDGTLRPDAPHWHIKKPDVSKLLRATEDAMIGTVMLDDCIVSEPLIRKVYANPKPEGAWICVEQLEEA